ncbi:MAG: hypothetical protein HQM10_14685 [Candidatus Riflebacteria bacterium]|nr:hypothetical protein [Candidatus Riflebacteria bacterium]
MTRNLRFFCFNLLFLTLISVFTSGIAFAQLAPEYMRNGETYLLVGDGAYKGVYRLNNPAGDAPRHTSSFPEYLYNPGSSIGMTVDLNRNIYTFTETVEASFAPITGNLARQVLDGGVTAAAANWGYHANEHYDHRSWGTGGSIYRTTGARHSAGPGTTISGPGGSDFSPPSTDTIHGGKQWYRIPNQSWYQSWDTASAIGGYSVSYKVYGDKVEGKRHNWQLLKWTDSNYPSGPPTSPTPPVVGISYELRTNREILNGCLDGCGGATGNYTSPAKPMYTSVAFMPPIGSPPVTESRSYFYSRETDSSNYSLTLALGGSAASAYTPSAANPIIGYPGDVGSPVERGTRWVGISLKDANEDYVYLLGSKSIKEYYQMATSDMSTDLNINAVAVSKQWNQQGGIIFAFDKTAKCVYKFVRKETGGAAVSAAGYEFLDNSKLGIPTGVDLDDIEADGFGSLFYSYTTQSPANTSGFNMNTDVTKVVIDTESGGTIFGRAVCGQNYVKRAVERNISDGSIRTIGDVNLGKKFWGYSFQAPSSARTNLTATPYANFQTRLNAAGGSWLTWSEYPPHTFSVPTMTELAVINIPTPPKVLAFAGKKSKIDITGPYASYPMPDPVNRHTNQASPLALGTTLGNSQVYFFMAENYPLPDGPQDPTAQTDWNGNGFKGGFITTITNPKSSAEGGKIFYRWRLWMVEDPYGRPATPTYEPSPAPPAYPNDSGQSETYGFYSPVGGKYILTCQVTYDWYNYDLLPFNALYSNRLNPPCYTTGTKADSEGKSTLISRIQSQPGFNFMNWATMSAKLSSDIIPDNTWSAIPIVVTTSAPPAPNLSMTARILRCDPLSNPSNPAKWAPQGSEGYHGIYTGKKYAWQMDPASQSNILDTNYTYLIDHLLNDYGDGLYANANPAVQFRNLGDEVRWDEDTLGAEFTGTINATMPNGIANEYVVFDKARSLVATYAWVTIPIPSDPATCSMKIKAFRGFRYKMWPRYSVPKPGGGTEMRWGTPFWILGYLTINSATTLMVVDNIPPAFVASMTTPRNLFGETGEQLAQGVGPTGLTNPQYIRFHFMDNNPWENGATLNGVTQSAAVTNRTYNNGYTGNNSSFNLKPVFSRDSNTHGVNFYFHTALTGSTHVTGIGTYTGDASQMSLFQQYYSRSWDPLPNTKLNWTIMNIPVNPHLTFGQTQNSYIEFSLDIADLYFSGIDNNRRIPINYANNTPGYAPYPFFASFCDASGNAATVTLNLALNVRDNKPPIPWGEVEDLKETSAARAFPNFRRFPDFDYGTTPSGNPQIASISLSLACYDNQTSWSPDGVTGVIPIAASGLGFTAAPLKTLKAPTQNVVNNFDTADTNLLNQVKANIHPNYIEDNVEFILAAGASDNAGPATNTLVFRYKDISGTASNITVRSRYVWPPISNATGSQAVGIIRGLPGQFPIACKVEMTATDDAKDWSYYKDSSGNANNWTIGNRTLSTPTNRRNTRTLNTALTFFESRIDIRTLEKSIQK